MTQVDVWERASFTSYPSFIMSSIPGSTTLVMSSRGFRFRNNKSADLPAS
jgi:hypothetical protein